MLLLQPLTSQDVVVVFVVVSGTVADAAVCVAFAVLIAEIACLDSVPRLWWKKKVPVHEEVEMALLNSACTHRLHHHSDIGGDYPDHHHHRRYLSFVDGILWTFP